MNTNDYEKKSVHGKDSDYTAIGIIIAVLGFLSSIFYIMSINRDMTPSGFAGINGDYRYPFTEYEISQILKLVISFATFVSGVLIMCSKKKIVKSVATIGKEDTKEFQKGQSGLPQIPMPLNIEDIKEFQKEINHDVDLECDAEYWNIALFGADSWEVKSEDNTCTDTIIIISINMNTKDVKLVSVHRNTWLNLDDDNCGKIKNAYERGGYQQAIAALNMNLDLDIIDFVTVGYKALINIVNALGGININVKEEEMEQLNSYQKSIIEMSDEMLNLTKDSNGTASEWVDYIPIVYSGTQTLNGLQATAYMCICYIGSETERTSRVKTVISKIARKVMKLKPEILHKIVDAVYPDIVTSLPIPEILDLLKCIEYYGIVETETFPFPSETITRFYDGSLCTHINGIADLDDLPLGIANTEFDENEDSFILNKCIDDTIRIIPAYLNKNVSLLHAFLFDEKDYKPSDTVEECCDKITVKAGIDYVGLK